jgi:class 3 adenylate cyclase
MEPRIQYAKTSDGVNIAFTTFGEGPHLVIPPSPVGGQLLQVAFDLPGRMTALERLAERAQVILYDRRGMGMSERQQIDFSTEAGMLDIQAVLDRLELDRVAVFGRWQAGEPPLAYAARHPERISHLVLTARTTSIRPQERVRALTALMDEDWELYTNLYARVAFGWDSPDATPMAALIRASHSSESWRAAEDAIFTALPESLAGEIRAPTLILYQTDSDLGDQFAGGLASRIANAQVLGIPGQFAAGYPNAVGIAAILDFISTTPAAPGQPIGVPELDTSAFRTILFTDIEEHTAMMQRLGDAKGRDVLREHERITREALRAHGGAEVKTIGDSFMASFPSTQKALECAIALQQAFEAQELRGERLRIRAGINAGEPIAEEDDLFGSSVILAARAKERAAGGEIVVTDVVRQLVTGKGFLFADRGEIELRGFEDPVRLYEVRWREEQSAATSD